ncbi:TIGR03790 family protein [Granulicella sp. dw_53]|uniref:TIGR03790 family protein n=1 Tax=Granulicella sp. dw_53 TaxID=2719792 RepID=UPI001BD574FD|nr:TIGR03790 family protein [Granulicella sp. dw_53]
MTPFDWIFPPAQKLARTHLLTLSLVFGILAAIASPSQAATPDKVLVVINNSSSTSRAIGMQYSTKRSVPNVLRIQCIDSTVTQDNETINFADYQQQIENPIRAFLQTHPNINFIVLTRGIPIRVAGGETGEAFSGQTLTSLDGTLAALDYDKIPGAIKITFNDPGGFAVGTAWMNRYWDARVPFSHAKFGGYLVTRLDGYSLPDAEALTTHALTAEKGLKNGQILLDIEPDFGIDDPSSQPAPLPSTLITQEDSFGTWNADMQHAGNILEAKGVPVDVDLNETFVGNRSNLLGYYSWGSNDNNFSQGAYNTLKFAPGAVGDTAVSTSARSFFRQSDGQSMIADLISQGITGVKGYTDEPLLQSISSPTIVLDRYTSGFTLAESFFAGSKMVGWTDIVVGDPLTHPYPSRPLGEAQK